MAKNDGKSLELLVHLVEEVYKDNPSTEIIRNHKIKNKNGSVRELDVFVKTVIGGYEINIAIECKDYKTPVSIDKIEAFNTKCNDIPEINKKIFVSAKGFQSGAIATADAHGIELYTFDEFKENKETIFLPLKKAFPIFKGYEVKEIYCDGLEEKEIDKIADFKVEYFDSDNEKFSLVAIINEGLKEHWRYFAFSAFFRGIGSKEIIKEPFSIGCNGLYFMHGEKKITVNEIHGNILFEIGTKDIDTTNKMLIQGNEKVRALTQTFSENDKSGAIVMDSHNELHFFDTTKNSTVPLVPLMKYDPKTGEYEFFDDDNRPDVNFIVEK